MGFSKKGGFMGAGAQGTLGKLIGSPKESRREY